MDHKQLKYFLALADTLHFGRASAQSFISAPTLSRQIKQLEEEVGAALFIRDNRSVMLTAQGRAFVDYANATLNQWRLFKSQCQEEDQPLVGEIKLFCSVTASYSYIYKLFARFRQNYPSIELNLTTGDPATSISQVQADRTDVAVAVKPKELPQGLTYIKLGEAKLVMIGPTVLCPITELLSKSSSERSLPWGELPFILPEHGVLKERLDDYCKKLNLQPKVYSHVSGHEAMVALVSLGLGIALVPDVVLEQSPFKNQVTQLPTNQLDEKIEIGLVCKKGKRKEPLIDAVWKTAEKVFI